MRLIKPSYKIEHITPNALQLIEQAGRTCYKSEDKITEESAEKFIAMLIKRGHETVLEHANMTVRFVCDRGVTHEIVRHRLVAYSQESTRYCNYKGGVTFIVPPWVNVAPGHYNNAIHHTSEADANWFWMVLGAEKYYQDLLELQWTPQQARSILPNSLKTEIVCTANFREWRHIFKLRTASSAHPQMREIMRPLLDEVKVLAPVIFDDINCE